MNFLPLEDIEVAWVHEEQGCPCEGHAWYDGQYCRFELDRSGGAQERGVCSVYILYAMRGETLVNELARRKMFELADDGALAAHAEYGRRDERTGRSEELQFIGRFIGWPSPGRDELLSRDDGRGRRWFALPGRRALGGMLHKQATSRRAG